MNGSMSGGPLRQISYAPQSQLLSQFAATQLRKDRNLSSEQAATLASQPLVNKWRIVRDLAGGGFSRVYLGMDAASRELVAIKVIIRKGLEDDKRVQKEIKIHSALKHGNILRLIAQESDEANSPGRPEWGCGPAFYIAMEYANGGDLFDKIPPDVGVVEMIAHMFCVQLLGALKYCHRNGICHRDIKPENILIDQGGNLKLGDFGLSSVFRYKGQERLLAEPCGSMPYAAPEVAAGKPYKAEPIDIWSAGALLFTLAVGNTPWDKAHSDSPEYAAYLNGSLLSYDPWTRIPKDLLSLLRKMLCVDADKRITLQQIYQHRWVTKPNSWLTADGQCTHPRQLYEALLAGLAQSGAIHEPEGGFVQDLPPEEQDDTIMPVISQVQGLAPSLVIYTAASMIAPSQRNNLAFNYFVTICPPEETLQRIQYLLSQISVLNSSDMMPLSDGHEGLQMSLALKREGTNGKLGGLAVVRRENPSMSDMDEDGEMPIYSVTFERKSGSILDWHTVIKDVRQAFAGAHLLVETAEAARSMSQR